MIGCFNPSSADDTEGTSGSGGTTEPATGAATVSATAAEGPDDGAVTDGPSEGDDTVGTTEPSDTTVTDPTAGTDSTGDLPPECDLPCPDGQFCVEGVCSDPPEGMVAVPAGAFWMGCEDETDEDCHPDQYPFHEVYLDAFAIDRTEATIDSYLACVDVGECQAPVDQNAFGDPCTWDDAPNGTYPITCINWFSAQAFCEWLGKRLPTEAEWEKAARSDDARRYPWGNTEPTCNHATANDCTEYAFAGGTLPVGSLPLGASPYGALDMAGNVFEWVADWYDPAYYVSTPPENPEGPANGTRRALRSCSSLYYSDAARTSHRPPGYDIFTEDDANRNIGVRCAISATP